MQGIKFVLSGESLSFDLLTVYGALAGIRLSQGQQSVSELFSEE